MLLFETFGIKTENTAYVWKQIKWWVHQSISQLFQEQIILWQVLLVRHAAANFSSTSFFLPFKLPGEGSNFGEWKRVHSEPWQRPGPSMDLVWEMEMGNKEENEDRWMVLMSKLIQCSN